MSQASVRETAMTALIDTSEQTTVEPGGPPTFLRLHVAVMPAGRRRGRPRNHRGFRRPDDADQPTLTANLVRRVIGKALIDAFCLFGEPRCQQKEKGAPRASASERCHLAPHCPYGVLYAWSQTLRPPFALYVGAHGPGNSLATLELTLFGPAWRLYPWLLTAVERALWDGLGKTRQIWRIEDVFQVRGDGRRRRLCGAKLSELPPCLTPEPLPLANLPLETVPTDGSSPLGIELLSPTRLIRDGRLLPPGQPVTFDLLIARLLDRLSGIYGQDSLAILNPEQRQRLQQDAADVPLLWDRTRWVEVKDYSSRSRSELLLGGLTGRLCYGAPASKFLPFLRTAEILHLGKNPTSGCGRLRVDLSVTE